MKKRFFDNPDDETLALTTNYKCNEWLDKADLKVFETMRKQNPRRYAVAGLGDWGIVDGLVYENWHEEAFTLEQIRQQYSIDSAFGLDFGYTNDPCIVRAAKCETLYKIWAMLRESNLCGYYTMGVESIIPFDVLRYNHEILLKGIKELPVEKTAKLIEEHYMIVPEVLHEKQCKKSE